MSELTIAFLTPTIKGHCNVHLATIRRLLAMSPDESPQLHIHLVSDEPLRKEVEAILPSKYHTLTFHSTGDTDYGLRILDESAAPLRQPSPSLFRKNGLSILQLLTKWFFPRPDGYLEQYLRVLHILESLQPDLALVDLIQPFAVDACKRAGVKFGIMSPVCSMHMARLTQPNGRAFWKYPVLWTPIPYPVPPSLIPWNAFLCASSIFYLSTSSRRRALDAVRHSAGLSGSVLHRLDEDSEFIICPSFPELEYPHVPLRNTIFVGPLITQDAVLSASEYPDIVNFLNGGRTAVINMGTLFQYNRDDVAACLDAFASARSRLGNRGGFQVLWKLPNASEFHDILEKKLGNDRSWLHIEEWLKPRTIQILKHPNIVVLVQHGGANTTHEGCYAGVPQIVLPQWYDLYFYARRVEVIGHGIYANKGHDAEIDGAQLADALVCTFQDGPGEPGHRLKTKARELAKICQATEGDKQAAETIIAFARGCHSH